MTAGLAIQANTNLRSLSIAPSAGLGILAAWTTTALLLGGSRSCWRRSRGLARPRAPSTSTATVSAVLGHGVKKMGLQNNPAASVDKRREAQRGTLKTYAVEEDERLAEAMSDEQGKELVRVAAGTKSKRSGTFRWSPRPHGHWPGPSAAGTSSATVSSSSATGGTADRESCATTQAGWPVIRERVRDGALPRSDVIRERALLAGTFLARRRLKG
jgi:hypothetical protein